MVKLSTEKGFGVKNIIQAKSLYNEFLEGKELTA
jgi:hypothetical protein